MVTASEVHGERAGERDSHPFALPFGAVVFQADPSRRGERVSPIRPVCPWCHHPFVKVRGNQIFCSRRHSQEACEQRKLEAVNIMAQLYEPFGLNIEHIREVAEVCWKRLRALVESFGFEYDEYAQQWRFSLSMAVAHLIA